MANASNTPAADNADQLRRRANRRLLGASVLLLIAIILVPMFLEREPPPLPDNVEVKIPPVEGTKFDPKLPDRKAAGALVEPPAIAEPVGAAAAVAAVAATAAQPNTATNPSVTVSPGNNSNNSTVPVSPNSTLPQVNQAVPAKAATEKVSEKPAEKSPEKTAAPPAAAKAASAAPATAQPLPPKKGQLVIQIVAVRDPENAKQAFDKAKSLGFPTYTEKITVSNGVVTRVRVGPYDDKNAAEKVRAKLALAGFEPKVLIEP